MGGALHRRPARRARRCYAVAPGTASQRAYVANTLGYRRRKGTLAVLEQLARDVTGWRARAVEFFQLLATTQHVNHVRLGNLRTPDLRDADALELLGGPFERAAHTAEVRRIPPSRGRYNIPNVGLFLWRLQSYPISRGTARQIGAGLATAATRSTRSASTRRSSTGRRPRRRSPSSRSELNVPAPLRRRALFDELEARRQAEVEKRTAAEAYFAAGHPVLRGLRAGHTGGEFRRRAAGRDPSRRPQPLAAPADLEGLHAGRERRLTAEDDFGRGRPAARAAHLPGGTSRDAVEVDYAYGFSGDMGGGPYDRSRSGRRRFAERVTWQAGVGKDVHPRPAADLRQARRRGRGVGRNSRKGTVGVIAILDSRTLHRGRRDRGPRRAASC